MDKKQQQAQSMKATGLTNNEKNASTLYFLCSNRRGKIFFSFLFFLFHFLSTSAQTYPVQINQNLIPPYNTQLSTYATTSDTKLNLQLLLTDLNENNRQIGLKLYIQGNGLNIQSAPVVIGAPRIFLDGGVPQFFTNVDLKAYFELNNLSGINPRQYSQPLPDGAYQICWEAYDHITNQPISQKSCLPVYLVLNDPPLLNLPQRAESIPQQNPVNIIFQWTPRHVNATNVSYEFELREVWDNFMDPQAAFLASPNYHTETTYNTTLLYDISKPALLPGKRYAWRIRAISTSGISENAVFKNNGFSEIFYFTYSSNCPQPLYTLSQALSPTQAKLTWQGLPEHNRYHVQYKKANTTRAEWFEVFTYNTQVQISNLEPGATYDFRVGGSCNLLTDLQSSFTYSNLNQFSMPLANETVAYNCGVMPEIAISNTDPLLNIGVNETFTAGDFPVTVKQIQGGNGIFSGTGYIIVPYLADTKIAVEFAGIKINTDYQLFQGIIKTTYDPVWGGVEDAEDLFNGGPGGGEEITINFPINFPDGIQVDPNGDIIIRGPGGEEIELPGGEDYVVTDGSSPPKQYGIDEDGNITELGTVAEGGKPTPATTNGVNAQGQAANLTAQGILVSFAKADNTTYGFDAYNTAYPNTQGLYTILGNDYYIPYKAVKNGDEDYIIADISVTDNTIVMDSLVFKTQDGTAIEVIEKNGTQWKLKVKGYQKDAVKDVLATLKQGGKHQVAGAFKLYHLDEKQVDVVLVNTNNANKQAIQNKLDEIYRQAVVKVNIVQEVTDFTIAPNPEGKIYSGESGFAANYTQQQQNINKELRSRQDYNANAYYLITTNLAPSTSGEQGLMPLGRQFGYVYSNNPHTVAHELGHGAFKLKHPFSQHSYGWQTNSTNWLMDYAGGQHLPHNQWQEIHNPNLRIGLFDKDSEGEYSFYKLDYVCVPVEYQNRNYTYLDLDGNAIVLGNGYAPAAFVGARTPEAKGRISIVRETSTGDLFYPLAGQNKQGYWRCRDGNLIKNEQGKLIQFGAFASSSQEPRLIYIDEANYLFVDNEATGELFEEARTCPILPKRTKEETTPNIRCGQMNHDLTIEQSLVNNVTTALNNAISNIDHSKININRPLGTFNHIFQINDSGSIALSNNEKQWEILEDKLHLLSYYRQDTYFILGLMRTTNNSLYTSGQLREIATTALDNIDSNKNVVLVLINGSVFESLFGETTTVCSEMGYAQNKEGVIDKNTVTNSGGNLDDLLSIYKSIEKPLLIKRYYLKADNGMAETAWKKTENIRGFSSIHLLQFFKSTYYAQIKEIRNNIYSAIIRHGLAKNHTTQQISEYLDQIEQYYNQIHLAYANAELEEIDLDVFNNSSTWEYWEPDNLGKLREPLLLDPEVSRAYFASQTAEWGYGQKFKIYAGFNTSLQPFHFYDFDQYDIIDPIVYGVADGLSMIPVPPLDSAGDALGLIYATARGDASQAPFYAVGLALPVGAGYLKVGSKSLDNVFSVTAKKLDDGTIELFARKANEIPTGEIPITTPLTNKLADAQQAKQFLDTPEYKQQIIKYLDEAASELDKFAEQVLPILDGLGWDEALKTALKSDYDNGLKALFDAADDARKVELVDSWKLLENSVRRTDIKTLKFFDDPTVVASRQKILNEKIHEAFPNVPLEELTAIQHYTTNAHLNLNKALRGEIPMTDEYRAFEELLNSGMDKLPKFNGDKVFRGVKGDEAILAKTWKEGDNVSFNDFKSTSTDDLVANDFAGDVVYEISNPKGRNICGVSCLPGESEVLFKSESSFKVKEIKPDFIVYDKDLNPTKVRKIYLEFVE